MIIIWDNGKHYSDHALHFIDTGAWALADVERLLGPLSDNELETAREAMFELIEWGYHLPKGDHDGER